MKAWMSGNVAGTGTFRCTDCDYPVSLDAVDELPTCPNCGGTEFVRASLFTTAQTSVLEVAGEDDDQGWLDEIREGLHEPGQYLAYRAEGESPIAYALQREWTRIGRSRHHLHFVDVPVVTGMRYSHAGEHGATAQTG